MAKNNSLFKLWKSGIRLNRRNHRKVCIIDQKLAFVGSANLTNVHSRACLGDRRWRDTNVLVRGVGVEDLIRIFQRAWRKSWRIEDSVLRVPHFWKISGMNWKKLCHGNLVRTNHSWMARRSSKKQLQRLFAMAKERIWITNAYFIPNEEMLVLIEDAAKRGVDVRVLVPFLSDIPQLVWATAALYPRLLKKSVRIFEFKDRMIHAKTILFDDLPIVGTSNLNSRSFKYDLEVDLCLKSSTSVDQLKKQFLQDISNSREVLVSTIPSLCFVKKMIGLLIVKLQNWM